MRRLPFVVPLLVALALAGRAKAAKLVFFGWGGETITPIVQLPDTSRYSINGTFVDIAVVYKQVTIFFLPVWQYDIRWAVAAPGSSQYFAIERPRIEQMARGIGATLPEPPPLGFWTEWGGKLVLGGGLLLILSISALRRSRA